ncbi:hypothetical protein JCM33374_g5312 [Metschnikowia sp. JCM 33374]|nr:hypothetical protein JCM33374_g5312 [Metschnikowia sp. JCM 33374]
MRLNFGLIAVATFTSMVLAATANGFDSESSAIASDVRHTDHGMALSEPQLYARGDAQTDLTQEILEIQNDVKNFARTFYRHEPLREAESDFQARLDKARDEVMRLPLFYVSLVKTLSFAEYQFNVFKPVLGLENDLYNLYVDDIKLHSMLRSRLSMAACYTEEGEADFSSVHFTSCARGQIEATAEFENEHKERHSRKSTCPNYSLGLKSNFNMFRVRGTCWWSSSEPTDKRSEED